MSSAPQFVDVGGSLLLHIRARVAASALAEMTSMTSEDGSLRGAQRRGLWSEWYSMYSSTPARAQEEKGGKLFSEGLEYGVRGVQIAGQNTEIAPKRSLRTPNTPSHPQGPSRASANAHPPHRNIRRQKPLNRSLRNTSLLQNSMCKLPRNFRIARTAQDAPSMSVAAIAYGENGS